MSPCIIIIFGATGDLTARKLMPALYNLYREKRVSEQLYIIGVGRREMDRESFAASMQRAVEKSVGPGFDLDTWGSFIDGMFYEQGFFEDPVLYDKVVAQLTRIDETMNACIPRFFYLATPPSHYERILQHLESSRLSEGCGQGTANFTRLLIEKPFGKDLETARALDRQLATIFHERQIYRIDHYLGKETVQNILALRFANGIFEPTWNREFVDHVQITFAEDIGVGTRGPSYDGVGALRDVVQNHMLEMLAVTAMEQPRGFHASSVRDKRIELLKSIECIQPEAVQSRVVRGQYKAGIDDELPAYTDEPGVASGSRTETFVALKLFIGTDRWNGVPFYLRTGKRLGKKVTEISLHYKKPVCPDDMCLFNPDKALRNVLTIRIQPDEQVSLRLMAKSPGHGMAISPVSMEFTYKTSFADVTATEAYERILLDAIKGDQTLFSHTEGIEASWQFVASILDGWSTEDQPLIQYPPGSWGPKESDELIERDGRHWYLHED